MQETQIWSLMRKILQATEQLNPQIEPVLLSWELQLLSSHTLEPLLFNKRGHHSEKLGQATKTQASQINKLVNKEIKLLKINKPPIKKNDTIS